MFGGSMGGIYRDTPVKKNDFVVYPFHIRREGSQWKRYWVDHITDKRGRYKTLEPPRSFGFHGYRSQQEAISAAKAYAKRKRINYTIYDQSFKVLSKLTPNPRPHPGAPPRRGRSTKQPASVLSSVRDLSEEDVPRDQSFDPERRYPRETKPHHFMVNSHSDFDRDEVVQAASRAFFVDAWTNRAAALGHTFPGENLMDVAPENPEDVQEWGTRFIQTVERLNDKDIRLLYEEAAGAGTPSDHRTEPTPETFGHYLAMQSLGHGVSWYDDHPEPSGGAIRLPNVETAVAVDPGDVFSSEAEFFEIDERFA